MSFDLFGPTTKKDIRVGYISTDRGYVKGITILEANKYAFKNPGTQFILETRDSTRYLNINQVNKLTPEDILPSNTAAEGTCDGIVGLTPETKDDGVKPVTPIVISGGGGVGAQAIPVVGNDGGILDAVVVHGGFGYKNTPIAKVQDRERKGSGAVLEAVVGVSTVSTLVTYTDEDDFEEYDFDPDNGNADLSGYGNKFGVNGEVVGEWDPTLYASLEKDPIGIEIARYQDFLSTFQNPWWHTRKEIPLTVAFGNKRDRVVHNVQHHAWDSDAVTKQGPNTQFQDVEFEVYTQLGASQEHLESGLALLFTAKDGSHFFKFSANKFLADDPTAGKKTKVIKQVKKNTTYIVTAKGKFKGGGAEQGLLASFGRKPKEYNPNEKRGRKVTGKIAFADLNETANDNDDLQVRVSQGEYTAKNETKDDRSTWDLTYRLDVKKPETDLTIKDSFMNRYAISPVPASDVPGSDYAGRWCTFEWEEDFPYTGEYIFRGMADNIGRIFLDNDLVMTPRHFRGDPLPSNVVKKTVEEGVHRIKVDLYNAPQYETITTNNTEKQRKKVPVEFDVYGSGTQNNTAISFVFTSEDGSHSFTLKPEKDRGKTYEYTKTVKVFPNTQYKVQSVPSKLHTIVNSSKFRTELKLKYDGLNDSNNPIDAGPKLIRLKDSHGDDINSMFSIQSTSPGVDAKFSQDGERLIVKGNGDVSLKLEWNDNVGTAGRAVRSITVGGKTFKQRGNKGTQTETIVVGSSNGSGSEKVETSTEQGTLKRDSFKKTNKKGRRENRTRSNVIFADVIGSANDNDDIQVRCKSGIFVPTNSRKVTATGPQGTQTRGTWDLTFRINAKPDIDDSGSGVTEIFNTTDYIDKADRKLWRTDLYNNASFLNEYGVCPFDTLQINDDEYPGTHVIRWEHISFPADGNYEIEVEVDDSVKLFIGNRAGSGAMEIGNGLKSVEEGGDEVIIEKNGFIGDSNRGTGKSSYTRFFKKGDYRIRAELYQKPGGIFGFTGRKSYGQNDGSNLSARFIREGNDIFLKIDGKGSATIRLNLNMDDNPRIAGHSLGSIRVGDVQLKRSKGAGNKKYKEKETISGQGTFIGGERYKIVVSGASAGVGQPRVNKDRIEFLDKDGNDANGTLKIGRISNRQGATVRGFNPMALAIRIRADITSKKRISPRTWNDNPMGAAFTIDAPLPPIPVSPKPISEGRCPENPTWTTRFSGGKETWWPVTHQFADGSRSWSKFMNRFAISPIPPLGTKNSDGGGIIYRNTWDLDIKHDGYYALKGTVDNGGRILIDDEEIMRGGYFKGSFFRTTTNKTPIKSMIGFDYSPGNQDNEGVYFGYEVDYPNAKGKGFTDVDIRYYLENDFPGLVGPKMQLKLDDPTWGQPKTNHGDTENKLAGFRTVSPPPKKLFLSKGKHTITVEVENKKTAKQRKIEKKIFSTQDWRNRNNVEDRVPVKFDVYGQGTTSNTDIKFVFTSEDGKDSFSFKPPKDRGDEYTYTRTVKVLPGTNYKVESIAGSSVEGKFANKKTYTIEYEGLNDANSTIDFGPQLIRLKDSHGDDINSMFSIVSTSPGVEAKFSSNGKALSAKGSGDVTLALEWNDNPNTAGKAVKSITIRGETFKQRGNKGKVTKVIKVGQGKLAGRSNTVDTQLNYTNLNNANNPITVVDDRTKIILKDSAGTDINAKITILDADGGSAKFSQDGQRLVTSGDITSSEVKVKINLYVDDDPDTAGVALDAVEIAGVTFRRKSGSKTDVTKTVTIQSEPEILPTDELALVPEQGTSKVFGRGKKGTESSAAGQIIFADIIGSANDNDDIQVRCDQGTFTPSNKRKIKGTGPRGTERRGTYDLTFRVERQGNPQQSITRDSVSYDGPRLFVIKSGAASKLWSKFMKRNAVSPFIPPINEDNPAVGNAVLEYTWSDVDFSETGQYKFLFQSDNLATLYIDGEKIAESRSFRGETFPTYAEISAGKYEVKVVCRNGAQPRNVLTGNNPTGFALKIMTDVVISETTESWTINPVGISAILIPPPCPKVVEGKGKVVDVIVKNPGNGYTNPPGEGIPTVVTLKDVEPTLPGINYDPNDPAFIDNIPTTIEVDNFGRVTKVNVPPIIITETPVIRIPSATGVGFRGTPIMKTTIVPDEVFAPEDIIQVTDLVGLKQNGYVNGKPYYGSVFSKDGQLFAGVYETTGDLIPVYATLQESIDNRITTRPSAILRQGTDINSNNPRLNIPGTPQNLI